MTSNLKFILTIACLVFVGCAELELAPIAEDVKKVFRQNIVTDQEISTAFKQVLETATRKSVDLLASSQGFI